MKTQLNFKNRRGQWQFAIPIIGALIQSSFFGWILAGGVLGSIAILLLFKPLISIVIKASLVLFGFLAVWYAISEIAKKNYKSALYLFIVAGLMVAVYAVGPPLGFFSFGSSPLAFGSGLSSCDNPQVVAVNLWGWYKCAPTSQTTTKFGFNCRSTSSFGDSACDTTLTCPADAKTCDLRLKVTGTGLDILTKISGWYQIGLGPQMKLSDIRNVDVYVATANRGDIITVHLEEHDVLFGVDAANTYLLIQRTPYQLEQYSVTGPSQPLYNYAGCSIPSANQPYTCVNCPAVNGVPSGVLPLGTQVVQFDQIVSFPDPQSIVPLLGSPMNYNGKQAWCSSGALYELKKTELQGGCFLMKGNLIPASIQCCPGETYGTATCGSDFKWLSGAPSECVDSQGCPDFINTAKDPTGHTRTLGTCTNGKCSYADYGIECSGSYQCPAEKPVCVNYKCQAGNVPQDCRRDGCVDGQCDITTGKCVKEVPWLLYGLLGLASFAVLVTLAFAISSGKYKSRRK